MPLRLSERTSKSRALSTIWRFVLRRVSLRAFLIKPSSISIFVLLMKNYYTPSCVNLVYERPSHVCPRGRFADFNPQVSPTEGRTWGTRRLWRPRRRTENKRNGQRIGAAKNDRRNPARRAREVKGAKEFQHSTAPVRALPSGVR